MVERIVNVNQNNIILKSQNEEIKDIDLGRLQLLWDDDYLIYRDQFNRKWKLEPVKNENIQMPFIITPLP